MKSVKYFIFGGLDENAKGKGGYAASCFGFYIDESGSLVKGNGLEEVISTPGVVTGMWGGTIAGKRILAFVAGNRLYIYNIDTETTTDAGYTGGDESAMFEFDGKLYILCSGGYYRYDGTTLSSVEGYIPLVAISSTHDGGGTAYESVNMLTPKRRQKFSCNGSATTYRLAERNIYSVISVDINGEVLSPAGYTVDTVDGIVTFDIPPAAGLNNMEITYSMTTSSRSVVLGCKKAMLFGSNADERIFLWGNALHPNCRYNSDLADGVPSAEYFPVTGYTYIGSAPITDIVQHYDRQLIFTKNSAYLSVCETRTSLSGQTYLSFPVYPLNPSKGSLTCCNGATVEGMPVSVCDDGINVWQATEVESQRNAVCISTPIKQAVSVGIHSGSTNLTVFSDVSSGRLFAALGNSIYVYDSNRKCWFKLEGITALRFTSAFGRVYIYSSGMKIYRLSPSLVNHNAEYTTHFTEFSPGRLVSINSLILTVKVGDNTAGSVSAVFSGGRQICRRREEFSIPSNKKGYVERLKIPMFIPYADGVSFTFSSPEGKELNLLGYEVIYTEKGEIPYGT